jgi:dihydrolipoamide dehydrogenase
MYDVIVIGAGFGGYEVARLLGKAGKKVCIIDKDNLKIGGTCLNEGYIPANNFLKSATMIKKIKHLNTNKILSQNQSINLSALQSNTTQLIDTLKIGINIKLKKAKVDIKYGVASFIDKNSIKITNENEEIIKATNIIIATGSTHKEHPILKLKDDIIISSKEAFTLKNIPKSILIIGGGAIGCKFATFFNALKSKVDIAEFTPKLLPLEDEDISRTLKRELEKEGIGIYLNANITKYDLKDKNIEITMDIKGKEKVLNYDIVLVSIGRNPNTKGLDTKAINLEMDDKFIKVDEFLRVSKYPNIYAIGDVIKTPALAHMAYYEAKCVSTHILSNDICKKAYIPLVTFCKPQIPSVGENEKTLKNNNIDYAIKKQFFKSSGKAKIKGDDSGFVKILYKKDSQQILGASIIGNEATEIIHELLIAIKSNLIILDFQKMIFAYPTLNKNIYEAVNL